MCGIIGILGRQPVAPLLLEALKRLEYRGYDSAGIATLVDARIERRRGEVHFVNPGAVLEEQPMTGFTGIGHTRWATHGPPTQVNAHPHKSGSVAVVHNGIIENFETLRNELRQKGHSFETQTDTEVVSALVRELLTEGMEPVEAAKVAIARFEGAFALALLFEGHSDLLICARRGSPLAIGYGNGSGEMYCGSDALALANLTDRIQYLEEGDFAVIRPGSAEIFDSLGDPVDREIKQTAFSGAMIGKGNHAHFMHKEIHEQPAVIGDTLRTLTNPADHRVRIPDLPIDFATLSQLTMVACGTASYACMVAEYWFEQLAKLPCKVDIASEFRYRNALLDPNGAGLFVSQSGETMDTLEAMRHVKDAGLQTLGVVNVPESTLAREASCFVQTLAGPEQSVASTKAFTTQLATLACLAIGAAKARGHLTPEREQELIKALDSIPSMINGLLTFDAKIQELAHLLVPARDVLYLGRGTAFAVALEGALKLKEISYIHAEGYAAGELKHGPIALIDEDVPVVVVAPPDNLFGKTASNLQEVKARGGKVILLSNAEGCSRLAEYVDDSLPLPDVDPFVAPILYSIPIQLLPYHTAVITDTDFDPPRNIAQSVTVE